MSKNEKNFTVRCIVLDSSNDENYKRIHDLIQEIDTTQNLIDLYKFDEGQAFWEKIEFGVSKANSEYCLICADDDFFTKDGITDAITSLHMNSEVITVRGVTGVFFDRNLDEVFLKEIDNPYDILGETSAERLYELVNNRLVQLVYSVYRTADLRKILRILISSERFVMLSPVFQEYMFYFTVAVLGKVQAIDILTNVRESSAESGSSTVSNFYHSICDNSFNENYLIFKANILKVIGEKDCSLINQIEFDSIFKQFMVNSLNLPSESVVFCDGTLDTKLLYEEACCYI